MKRHGVRKATINKYGNFLVAVKNYCDHKGGIISSKDIIYGIKNYKVSKTVHKTMNDIGILSKIERGEYKWVAGRVTEEMAKNLAVQTYIHATQNNKPKSKFTPPNHQDVSDYFYQNGYDAQLGVKFIAYYEATGWKQKNGNQIKNWKKVAQNVWFENPKNDRYKLKKHKDIQIELEYPEEDILTKEITLEQAFPNYKDSKTTVNTSHPQESQKPQKRIKLFWGLIDITI